MNAEPFRQDPIAAPRPHGAVREPFQDYCDEHCYYADPARDKALNLLLHLAPYSDLLLVTGPQGSGKSAFIHRFLARAHDNWRVLALQGSAAMDAGALLETLDRELSVRSRDDGDSDERMQRLRRNLDLLRRGGLQPIVLVDDAHLLDMSAFGVIAALIAGNAADPGEEGGKPIGFILAGEGGPLVGRLSDPYVEGLVDRVRHTFEIGPFLAEEETGAYIRRRLEGAGARELADLFPPSVVRFIHTAALGLPGRISELARVVLENKRYDDREASILAGSSTTALLRYGLLTLLLSLGIVALVYRDQFAEWFGDDAPALVEAVGDAGFEPVPEAFDAPEGVTEAEPELDPGLDSGPEDVPAIAEALEEPTTAAVPALVEAAEAPVVAEPPPPVTEATPAAKPAPVPAVAPTPAPNPTPEGATPRDEAWLLAQDPAAYTLQLFASDEARIRTFIEEHGLQAEAATFLSRTTGDRALYAVTWGLFPTRQDAVAAGAEWVVAGLRGVQPWARPLREIQTLIQAREPAPAAAAIGSNPDTAQ